MVLQLIEAALPAANDLFVYDVYSLAEAATGRPVRLRPVRPVRLRPVRLRAAAGFRPLLGSAAWAAAVAAVSPGAAEAAGWPARILPPVRSGPRIRRSGTLTREVQDVGSGRHRS